MNDEELYALKDRAVTAFLDRPGVTAVGIGARERGGVRTGELVLKVLVEVKRPLEELPAAERLPAEFEGMPVDVGVCGYGRSIGGTAVETAVPPPQQPAPQPGSPPTAQGTTDGTRQRPLIAGSRIVTDLDGAGAGTLGCFLKHRTDPNKVYALTVYHAVVVLDDKGVVQKTPVLNTTKVGQPSAVSSPTKCSDDMIGVFGGGNRDTLRDAAVVTLDPGQQWLAEIIGIGPVKGRHVLTPADAAQTPPYQLRKRGERTLLTGGTIEALVATTRVDGIIRANTTLVKPNPSLDLQAGQELFFGAEGDSGSVVVNDNAEVVGLLFGRSTPPPPGQPDNKIRLGFVTPIDVVLAQLDQADHVPAEVATATANGVVNTVPGAAPVRAIPPGELPPALAPALSANGDLMTRVSRDLDRSAAGRLLITLWLDHHEELLDLVGNRRRVTIAWHRGGGPVLLQSLLRMAADPALPMPATINGVPPADRLDHIVEVVRAHASPRLRVALDRARAALPDPASLTYDQFLAALAVR